MTTEENKVLCDKYPWLVPRNRFTGEISKTFNYRHTELDNMEPGWRKAFGEQFCEDMQNAINNLPDGIRNEFRLLDIKEKYASLRVYVNISDDGIADVINKYEKMSKYVCGKCGKPATKITTSWFYPFCDECLKESGTVNYIDIKEFYKEIETDEES